MKKLTIDIIVNGHSMRSLTKKVILTLRYEGPVAVARKTAIFTARHTFLGRYVPGWSALHVSPVYIQKWYAEEGQPVTIVIPSYKEYPALRKNLESIAKTVPAHRYQVIVVDDLCTDVSRRELKTIESDKVKVIYREANGGFAKCSNTGLAAVKTGDVVLLNQDIVVKKGWLEALQFAAYKFDKNAGIVGPKLLYPNNTIQYGGSHRNNAAPEWFDHYYRFQPSNYGPANVPQHVIATTGACMYIKREVMDKIGLLDEKYGMAFEDMDYCLRAWEAGFRCLYFPIAVLTHAESTSRGREQGPRELAAKEYFWKKWGDWFDKRNVRNAKGQVRIIYCMQTTGVSGGARIIYEHLNRLAERGYDVELFSLDKTPDWMTFKVPHRSFKDYDAMIETLEQEEAIKVATWWETAQAVWLGSVRKGIPAYFVQDIESSYYRDDPLMQQTVLSFYRREFNYLTTTSWQKDQLAAMHITSTVVPCGIDLKMFRPLPDIKREKDVLLTAGRKHYLKNFALTLSAWKQMAKQPRLWMFGVEPDLATDQTKMKYYFKPTDEKVNELYNQATVFAQTSRHEGFCLPIVEAMAAGVPVVCTDADGNRGFCHDNENCLMVEQDNVGDVKAKLEKLFGDTRLQEKLREAGYKTAADFSWDIVTDQLEDFYTQLAEHKQLIHKS